MDDLANSMSLNISKVWLMREGQEVLVSVNEIQEGDLVRVHMGNVIPFDGAVTEGEAMVNQASLTGEALPVRKCGGGYVYAGTVVEEGELTLQVKEINGSSRFEKIVTMIEESEQLKSALESKAEHLADKLVPYTTAGYRAYLSADKKYHKGSFGAHGRFLLRAETGHADFRAVCHPGGQRL